MKITQYLLLILIVTSCIPADQETRFPEAEFTPEEKQSIFEKVDDSGRIVWQKPEEVVAILGDISNKTIADIGAGSGYFTFRFALKAKKVIAIDIDPIMIKIIETFKQQLPSDIQSKVETRLAKPSDPLLNKGEADVIVIINTIAYIENRSSYLENLKDVLAEGGEIFILDFKSKKLSINAPGMEYRVPLGSLEQELEQAGFTVFDSNDQILDYQYIVRARLD